MTVNVKGTAKPVEMSITNVALSSLEAYENNPRNNEPNVPKMVELIKRFGFRVPMLVKGNLIVDGHLRYKAATAMGLGTVPVIDVGEMPDADVRALRLVINKSVEWSAWDRDKLGVELKALMGDGLNLSLTGFSTTETDRLVKGLAKEPLNLNPNPGPKVKDANAGTGADPEHVSLAFTMASPARDNVMKFLLGVQKEKGLLNISQALVALAEQGTAE